MSVNQGLFCSTSDLWETPQDLFDALDKEFHFTLDPCATHTNAKCESYYTEAEDGLIQSWAGVVFMNPPYGRKIGSWVQKAFSESMNGVTVVCLLPARTDTKWWHSYVMRASEVRFIKGRLKFSNKKQNAPFPSAVVVFKAKAALNNAFA